MDVSKLLSLMDVIKLLSAQDPREVYEEQPPLNPDEWDDAVGEFNHRDEPEPEKKDGRWID